METFMNRMNKMNKYVIITLILIVYGCGSSGEVVRVTDVSKEPTKKSGIADIGEKERAQLAEIKAAKRKDDTGIQNVIETTKNYTVREYLSKYPEAATGSPFVTVGPHDILDIIVYEEQDLSRQNVHISADGFISFPLIGRIQVEGLTTSEIEKLISDKLSEGKFLLDAHVSVTIREFKSKKFIVLGSIRSPGTYPLQAKERILDVISRAGGIDTDQSGKSVMVIRTLKYGTNREEKIVIRVDLNELMRGDPVSNMLIFDKDVIYIPKAENYYIIGQVKNPGSFPYTGRELTVVEAIIKAGGFTPIAARNRTRIIRVEDGIEKIYEIRVDEITEEGKRVHDIQIKPGDVIVVPESLF